MNYSNYSFTLNLQIHQSQISIPVSLNDTARKLYITFIDGRKPYRIPDGCRAVFVGFKSNETTLFNDCIIQENKTVIYEFTEQTANVEGVVNCEIRLYGEDGKQLTSSQFIMIVDENDTRDISLSENESTAIDNIIHAEISRVEAEAEREAAEKSRKELADFLATSGGVIVSDEEPKEGLANVWVDDSPEKEEIRLLDSTDIAQELTDDDEKIPSVALLKKSLDEIETGAKGNDGLTPYIGDNGNWWIGETDTGVKAEGKDGKDGVTIASIIENDDETAICFSDGTVVDIKNGKNGTNGRGISSIVKTTTNGRVDTYTITYTDKTTSTFTVTNGANGTSVTIASIGEVIDETTEEVIGHTVNFSDGKTITIYNGKNGENGKTPYIKNKTWWIGDIDTGVKAEGTNGTSITVTSVTESTASGGSNIVTFSDGKTLTVKNGVDGKDYVLTPSDKTEIAEMVSKIGTPEIIISFNENGYWYNHNGIPEFYAPSEGGACSKETNYIEATEGDIFRVTTRTSDGHCANGAWYDANKDLISSIVVEGDQSGEKTVDLIAPAGTAYARFFSMTWTSNSASDKVVLTVEYMGQTSTVSIMASPLKGKKIVYDGDSICSSWGTSRNGGSYPKIIADIVEGEYDNQGVGGGRIVTQEGSSDTFHSIVDNLVNLPTDGDLYCFEGGVNDHWHGVPLGTFSESDYTGELDKTTFCGALEYIFRYAITNFVGKPICYIITHKCPTSAFTSGYFGSSDTFADFRKKALGICEKYSIPVYDAWKDSGINSWNASQLANYFIISESTGTGDGTHPNEQGYRRYYVPQLIKLFEQIMPIGATEPEQPDDPTYTNLLDTVGWTEGIYLSGGVEKPDDNAVTTGYIPVVDKGTIYLKNVTMPDEAGHGNRVDFYREDKSFIGSLNLVTGGGQEEYTVYDASGNLVQFYFHVNDTRFIRLSAWNIDETSIITYNEPIE